MRKEIERIFRCFESPLFRKSAISRVDCTLFGLFCDRSHVEVRSLAANICFELGRVAFAVLDFETVSGRTANRLNLMDIDKENLSRTFGRSFIE